MRKGKILRNIADLLIYVVFLGYTIAVFFIPDDYEYDYVVFNDTVENAANCIEAIITAERHKLERNKNIISEVINNV